MIPHRMLSNEVSGSAVKNRVTACRKRLRENRVMLKVQTNLGVESLFPEARESLIQLPDQTERDEQTKEQEVGIT